MVLSSVRCLQIAARSVLLGDCVKHAALSRAIGIAREKLNGGNTSSFNPQVLMAESHQP